MYGSTVYGICFEDSQVDVDIEYVKSSSQQSTSQILSTVAEFLQEEMSDVFELEPAPQQNKSVISSSSNNANNLNKISYILTTNHYNSSTTPPTPTTTTTTTVNTQPISFNFTSGLFSSAFKTSFLIKSYLDLDERARILAFCLRYIAKVIKLKKKKKIKKSVKFKFSFEKKLKLLINFFLFVTFLL